MTPSLFTVHCSLFTLFLLLTIAHPLYAHAELVEASPAPGEALAEPPGEIRLKFNEPITADSTITLFTPNFQTVSSIMTRLDENDPTRMIASLPPLPPDTYTVQWTAVSADGHQIQGSYTFTVLPTPPQPAINWTFWSLVGLVLVVLIGGILVRLRQ